MTDQPQQTLQLTPEALASLQQSAQVMAADPAAANSVPSGYVIELENLTMDEYDTLMEVMNAGKPKPINAALAPLVKEWPHVGDPGDPLDWGKLKIKDWRDTVRAVSAAAIAIFQQA